MTDKDTTSHVPPRQGPQPAHNLSVWQVPGFALTMVAVSAAFGAFSLLLPVLPMQVLDDGGSATLAGSATGAFMAATVATQVCTPWLLRQFGYRPVMAISAFMLGVPALGHLLGTAAWVVLVFSLLRGVGFGALTVAQAALMAELVPLRFLGKASGTLGIFVGLAQMVFLPVGLALVSWLGYNSVYITAGTTGVIALVMCLRIPAVHPEPSEDHHTDAVRRVPMWKLVAVPALALTTFSMSFGVMSSFLPTSVREIDPATGALLGGVMLSIVGGAVMLARYGAGIVADRIGQPGRLYIPSQFAAFLGMALLAATMYYEWSVWWAVLAAAIFGAAFGAAQNEALLLMFARLPRSRISEASAAWNIFYDAGTGLGSVLLAGVVTGFGYAGAYGAGALIIIAGVAVTGLDLYLGRHRVTEYDNIRTRLRRMRKV